MLASEWRRSATDGIAGEGSMVRSMNNGNIVGRNPDIETMAEKSSSRSKFVQAPRFP